MCEINSVSVPARANDHFLQATRHAKWNTHDEMVRGLCALKDILESHNAVQTFAFKGCAFDRDTNTLYARFKIDDFADNQTDIYLTPIDLSDMVRVIEHNRSQVDQMPQEWQVFLRRFDAISNEAVEQLVVHQKTVEWLKHRAYDSFDYNMSA